MIRHRNQRPVLLGGPQFAVAFTLFGILMILAIVFLLAPALH